MAKVSVRRKTAGKKNLTKAHAMRTGRRGTHYNKRKVM